MRYVRLGKTDLEVSTIAFGTSTSASPCSTPPRGTGSEAPSGCLVRPCGDVRDGRT
jgi:aryl-alcohol dehydrogenase-like predicted oxidoreductase